MNAAFIVRSRLLIQLFINGVGRKAIFKETSSMQHRMHHKEEAISIIVIGVIYINLNEIIAVRSYDRYSEALTEA